MKLFRFLAFARRHRMLSWKYARLYYRYLWRRYLTVAGTSIRTITTAM